MKEPLIGPDWCIFTFYDQPSSKQLALLALERDFKYRPVHTQTQTQIDKYFWRNHEKPIQPSRHISASAPQTYHMSEWRCQLDFCLQATDFIIRFVELCLVVAGFFFFSFFFQSCRHSSSSLQLKPCVVEKQASVCGEIACLEWEGACRLQRSQSEHANSFWPSHTPCWRMHLNSQSGIPPNPPSRPPPYLN